MTALESLRARIGELSDLSSLARLASWDQRVMMPASGAPARAQLMATVERLYHDRSSAPVIGEWLATIEADAAGLSDVDRDLVRLARRDYDRVTRVPEDLAAELAHAGAAGQAAWERAREASDFLAFAPFLSRNVELARAYAACFEGFAHPYDALLADYDWGLTAGAVRSVFGALEQSLVPLVADAAARQRITPVEPPVAAREVAVNAILARLGVADSDWRVDVSVHPFTSWLSSDDIRVTTRYSDGQLESILAAVHEFGHGLYERQIPAELARTNLGGGTSMSVHESQSKLWENHVGRHPAFASVIASELGAAGFETTAADLHATMTAVAPSLIRVSADPLTYPLHIVLRFELEVGLIEGSLAIEDAPAAWNDGMQRLLGITPPDDAHGILQDTHWAGGAFGYFPSYALGSLIAAQLWETLESAVGPLDSALEAGETGAIASWLADHVHVHGRRLDTEDLVRAATGSAGIDAAPFLRYVAGLLA